MRNGTGLIALIVLLSLVGCTGSRIVVDMKDVDPLLYEQDLAECQDYRAGVNSAGDAATGTATGAAMGGLTGAIVGNSTTAARGAGVGALWGLFGGLSRAEREKQQIVKQCLRGRGYRVLN